MQPDGLPNLLPGVGSKFSAVRIASTPEERHGEDR
jgi:hypothetical protein